MSEPHRTPLNDLHRELGARLIDFAGWEMPVHYGSQIEEHHRVRRGCGVFDVSHMRVLDVEGPEAAALVARVCCFDVRRLEMPGAAAYGCLLNEDGGIIDDLIAYRLGAQRLRLVLNAATADGDIDWIRGRGGDLDATLSPREDLAILAVQGPTARDTVWRALPHLRDPTRALPRFRAVETNGRLAARTGYTGEDGFELMLAAGEAPGAWRALLAQGGAPCGLGARDTLRLEAGMNLYGQDMDATVTPLECGLAAYVDLASGRDFIGRAALARRTPRFRRLGLVLRDRGVLRHGQRVVTRAGEGVVTSGGFAPTLNRSVALARLPLTVGPGEGVEVSIRDKMAVCLTVDPPFARDGRALVAL
ncbi:MAG TPA: glycine cleavage system aminomethyltransferase GcvT [Pelomicrobium sp.]|nr:glycine cleavage system aminomethyltransferase GcvT [Pelomicrobium sp.]